MKILQDLVPGCNKVHFWHFSYSIFVSPNISHFYIWKFSVELGVCFNILVVFTKYWSSIDLAETNWAVFVKLECQVNQLKSINCVRHNFLMGYAARRKSNRISCCPQYRNCAGVLWGRYCFGWCEVFGRCQPPYKDHLSLNFSSLYEKLPLYPSAGVILVHGYIKVSEWTLNFWNFSLMHKLKISFEVPVWALDFIYLCSLTTIFIF